MRSPINTPFLKVEFPEFVELVNRLERGATQSEANVLAAFQHFDPSGSGFVDEPEVSVGGGGSGGGCMLGCGGRRRKGLW
jgi:hypothetical protein